MDILQKVGVQKIYSVSPAQKVGRTPLPPSAVTPVSDCESSNFPFMISSGKCVADSLSYSINYANYDYRIKCRLNTSIFI